jgi:DeoR/GlpR family transcriptional regulator of sugar metabolism
MIDRVVASFAPELIVVADSSKFGKISTSSVADLDLVSTIVTDDKISPVVLSRLTNPQITSYYCRIEL